jgi:nitroimidazol reductase NimA-like FMN-containing flavoprotein (pyridoxamine 5'-phosphate oxidase superfamily)
LNWRSALAFGNLEEVTDESERQEVLTRLLQKYPMMTPVEWSVVHDADTQDLIVFRIEIDRLTGVAGH